MIEKLNDELFDLLTQKALFGLEPEQQTELNRMLAESGRSDDGSFDIAAAAVGLINLRADEPLPEHLRSKILASGDAFLAKLDEPAAVDISASEADDHQKVFSLEPRRRSWNWLGWAVAALACIALAFNIWSTRTVAPQVAVAPRPTPTVAKPSMEQEFAAMMAAPSGMVKASFAPPSPKSEMKDVAGDVVWSDQQQKGFMRLRGLPVNDTSRSTYQLWIFDKTQDKATPIDGGTFNVDKNGEILVPINAKLKAEGPELFAITVEKPGGVVVSKREKIAALAKVETQSKADS